MRAALREEKEMDRHMKRNMDLDKIQALKERMVEFYRGCPEQIQHFLKVYAFAEMIGEAEGLDEHTLFLLKSTALVHDIGIRPAKEKYGYSNGKLQEQEGPAEAGRLLDELGYGEADRERICYLVGHHHTYTGVDGADYRILLEADFLVNGYEEKMSRKALTHGLSAVFETETGKRLLKTMFDV